ncbi:MAG: response regulator [Tatlockia sp.]|nr:response regulator [Tatlockia sp.]
MKPGFKAFSFKTQIVLIDDNKLFLNALDCALSDTYQVNSFLDPYKAIDYIASSYEESLMINASNFVIEVTDEDDDNLNCYSVEFPKIKNLIDNAKKNNTISVVIVDYTMPLMNGIEFCEKIAHLPILKIMLTGHADFNIAIDAFNRGIIDRFLVKGSSNMDEAITENIDSMQSEFFEKHSYPLLNCLSATKNTLINSSEYKEHFREIIQQLNAIEYYMLDSLGSYLIISEQGIHYYFVVLLDMQLDVFIDIAKNSHATPDLLKKIESKMYAPILLKEEDYKIPVPNWNSILHSIEKKNEYYSCLIPINNN